MSSRHGGAMILWVKCHQHEHPAEFCSECRTALDLNGRQASALGLGRDDLDEWLRGGRRVRVPGKQ